MDRDEIIRVLRAFEAAGLEYVLKVASFDTIDAEIKEVQGTRVKVATPLALYRLKKVGLRQNSVELGRGQYHLR